MLKKCPYGRILEDGDPHSLYHARATLVLHPNSKDPPILLEHEHLAASVEQDAPWRLKAGGNDRPLPSWCTQKLDVVHWLEVNITT